MTAYNPPPGGYYSGYQPASSGRPGVVTTVAILAIVFGSLMLLCGGFTLVSNAINFGPPNPVLDEIKKDTTLMTINIISAVAYLVLGFLGLFGGIACLGLKPAGRSLIFAYSILSMVLFVGGVVVQIMYTGPMTKRVMDQVIRDQQAKGGPAMPFDMDKMMSSMQIVGMVINGIFMVGLPIVLMALITRPRASEAFARGSEGGAQGGGYYQG